MRVIEIADYDNYLVDREDKDGETEQFIAHISFLVSFHSPTTLLDVTAKTSRRSSSMIARSNGKMIRRRQKRLWEQRRHQYTQ